MNLVLGGQDSGWSLLKVTSLAGPPLLFVIAQVLFVKKCNTENNKTFIDITNTKTIWIDKIVKLIGVYKGVFNLVLLHRKKFSGKSQSRKPVNFVVLFFLRPPYLRFPAKSSTKFNKMKNLFSQLCHFSSDFDVSYHFGIRRQNQKHWGCI